MPQLDPSTWFPTLVMVWLSLIIFMPIKITGLKHLNNPSMKNYKSTEDPWLWPWT